jgi:hypothetical protein
MTFVLLSWGVLLILVLLFQFVGMKVIMKTKTPSPCPASHVWALNNQLRRWCTRNIFKRMGLRPGEKVLEIGPGVGTFTERLAQLLGPSGRLKSGGY